MKRLLLLFFVILLSPNSASALEVRRFKMGTHRWTIVHQPGGLTVEAVERNSQAVDVSVFGFFGAKTINGQSLLYGVDWHWMYGRQIIADHYNRWVIASYPDGTVRICSSPEVALAYGKPSFGAAGMKVPPYPDLKLMRQFWAVKGRYYFRVKMYGDRWDCLRLAKAWGFEAMVHGDGDTSLDPWAESPSIAKVYTEQTYDQIVALNQSDPFAHFLN